MTELGGIKDRLRDVEKIERLLEEIGCQYIKQEQHGKLITAQLPERFDSRNKRAVQVRLNDGLTCYIRNRPDFEGDIFNLISYIHFDKRGEEMYKNLYNSKEFICKLFGWNEFLTKQKGNIVVKDYTASLKELIGKKEKKKVKSNPILPEEIMQQFYFFGKPLPFQGWIDEGISYKTQVFYGVGFDLETKRVVFPIRNRFGQLIGVKGRIMKTEDDPERKYLYLYPCNNSYELFNFWNAHPYILIEKRVYIFESEKSCMKAFDWGVYNTVAIGASDITIEQADIIKKLGLDIEIILCYDKDKTTQEIKRYAKVFEGRKVYGMFDTEGLLQGKDAPVDRGFETWNQLVKNHIYEIRFDKNI